jgi:hypothetical protein
MAIDGRKQGYLYDALMLLRSMRVLGGRLSQADVRAALIVEERGKPIAHTAFTPQSYLAHLASLGAIVHLRPPFSDFLYPTANKFLALENLPLSRSGEELYDFVLYLDTDVFVLRDPLVDLPLNDAVQCVPSASNYMEADTSKWLSSLLGSLDTYAGSWQSPVNASVSVFQGSCNTGMLFMPVASARKLYQHAVNLVDQIVSTVVAYLPERAEELASFVYIDSWAIFLALRRLKLHVQPLPPEYNFFVSAQTRIQQAAGVPSTSRRIRLLHFMMGTYLIVVVTPDCSGTCQPQLSVTDGGDAILGDLYELVVNNNDVCRLLAGCGLDNFSWNAADKDQILLSHVNQRADKVA